MQSPARYCSARLPTPQDVIDVIQLRRGVGRIHGRVRVLDQNLQPKVLPNPLNPDDPSDISAYVVGCQVEHNADRDVPRSCKLTLRENRGIRENVDTLHDRFQTSIVYLAPDGTELMDVPIGTFAFLIADKSFQAGEVFWDVGGGDFMYLVKQLRFLNRYVVPGTAYILNADPTAFSSIQVLEGPQVFLNAIAAILEADNRTPAQGGRVSSPAAGTSTTTRYCAGGFHVSDPASGCFQVTASGLTQWVHPATHALGVVYNALVGSLIDHDTGAPFDPGPCTPMAPVVVTTPAGETQQYYRTSLGFDYDVYTGDFTNPTTGQAVSWQTGAPVAAGTAPLLQLALGVTGSTATWPDPGRPALTPDGCLFYGPNVSPDKLFITPYGGDAPSAYFPVPFDVDSEVTAAINELAAAINYESVWADETWGVHTRPLPWAPIDLNGTVVLPSVADWRYSTTEPHRSVLDGTITVRVIDQESIVNVVQVVSEHDRQLPIVARLENNSPDSAVSFPSLGYRRERIIKDDKLMTFEQVLFRAWVELNYAAIGAETVEFDTWVNPLHQNRDLLDLNFYRKNGTIREVDSSSRFYPFTESGWTIDLLTLRQHHVCSRLIAL